MTNSMTHRGGDTIGTTTQLPSPFRWLRRRRSDAQLQHISEIYRLGYLAGLRHQVTTARGAAADVTADAPVAGATTTAPHCPSWCTRTPEFHAEEAADPQGCWFAHSGPEAVGNGWSVSVDSIEGFNPEDSEPAAVMVRVSPDAAMTGQEARALAVQLLAAAEQVSGRI